MESNNSLDKSSLVNILTLRYDPSIKPNLPLKTPQDFSEDENFINNQKIEDSICNEIQKKINDNKVSIALSGGVDSTLMLALLRKVKPNEKIHAVSIKFSNSVDETIAASKIAEKFGKFLFS